MNLDYFEYCQELILQFKDSFFNNNKYEIYKLVKSLVSVVAISYFCLTEDIIITKVEDSIDNETRFSANISSEKIDSIFEKNLITINKKMSDSKLWLISTIRNSILHGNAIVDLENEKILINNSSFNNILECEVPFKWFFDYMLYVNVASDYISDDFSFVLDNSIDISDKSKELMSLDSEYIYEYLIYFYNINIRLKEGFVKKNPKQELIRYVLDYSFNYDDVFKKIRRSVNISEIIKKKIGKTEDEIYSNMFKKMFVHDLKVSFEEKYPNYEILIKNAKPKLDFPDFLKELVNEDYLEYIYGKNDINDKLKTIRFVLQDELIKDDLFLYKDEMFLKNIISNFLEIIFIDSNNFLSEEDINELLNIDSLDFKKVYERIMQRIKKYNRNSEHTYDEIIMRKILQSDFSDSRDCLLSDIINKDIPTIKRCYYDEDIIKSTKEKYPYLFEKYSEILSKNNSFSDQDDKIFRELPIEKIEELGRIISEQKDNIMKLIIYLSGINCFVLNKEAIFDLEEQLYKDVLNDSFKAYKDSALDNNYNKIQNDISKISRQLSAIKKMKFDTDKTPKDIIDKYNRERNILEQQKQRLLDNASLYDVKKIGNKRMIKVSGKECATLIRNSLSHPERIEIDGQLIRLNDYDSKDNLTGQVCAPFDELINFFYNDTFKRVISNKKI